MRVGLALGSPADAVAEAQWAEDQGLDFVGSGEHLFFHGPTSNSFAVLAAAAGATSRVRLLSSVALLPLYPAPVVAKLAATLDLVSGGRYDLGVGAGGEFPAEFAAAGVDPETRFRRLDEGLMVIRRLFGGDPVGFDGAFTTLDDVTLDPPPVQAGGPPIWLGGRKQAAQRRAGRHADVWMPYLVDPDQVARGLAVAGAAAAEVGRGAPGGALFAWTAVDADSDRARRIGVEAVSATYAQDFEPLADRYLLVGDPNRVVARLAEFAAAGVAQVLIAVAARDPDDRRRVLDTLVADVLPAVQEL